ncbi:efflux RND transporter periplasmic adaptor subunit [Fulvivirgaceae bacterium PWU4]|uniref:Efflux RND transporter periplasmic adaptor subunit n=1 Tax=Chryseosolibacter histidini TaxID=2782349 RepID=A0AAP2DN03_9BACT|nr:efflux RND transporter periplasmic adaptor subunit [Chryseosolibacter histidini]MBT1699281.1 efflux RND transporter periplasmic adaptor subunit [Chryseosolibacter histidini]
MKHILIISVLSIFVLACSNEKKAAEHEGHAHAKEEAGTTKYTCPMHPNVVKDGPGKCPVCGMDLVPVNKTPGGGSNDLMLSDSQIRLANITIQKVISQPIGQTVVVNAKLTVDQNLSEIVGSRAAGRIEKLYVKETGRTIRKGEPLYQLYSEALLTLQREFLLAKEQYETLGSSEKRYKAFYNAARRKLLLYGLTEGQVEELAQNKAPRNSITFLSPASGVVTEISAAEGQYVSEGASLLKIENIAKLWLEAELYPNETSLAKVGDRVKVRVSGSGNENVEATIDFFSPEYRANTQIVVMRASLQNPDQQYKPGMQAQVFFSHSSKKALAVPVDAVIRDGKGAHVYVQRGVNTFRPQMVKTGIEDFDKVEITEGLVDGDTVAVTGAYLLYSEIILKKGTDPMAGHNH